MSSTNTLRLGSEFLQIRAEGAFISTKHTKDGVTCVTEGPNRCSSDRAAQRVLNQEARTLARSRDRRARSA
jgi:hypothetical protein